MGESETSSYVPSAKGIVKYVNKEEPKLLCQILIERVLLLLIARVIDSSNDGWIREGRERKRKTEGEEKKRAYINPSDGLSFLMVGEAGLRLIEATKARIFFLFTFWPHGSVS